MQALKPQRKNSMKILVCLKAVAENIPESDPKFLKDTFLKKDKDYDFKINKFDDHALEEAVSIKNTQPDTEIHTITIGSKKHSDILKKAIGKGADKAILAATQTPFYHDTEFVSEIIKSVFLKNSYHMIFCGLMSEDMMNGTTGHLTAGKLNMPSFSGVISIKETNEKAITFVRETEGGSLETIESEFPCVLNFQAGINKLSYPNVMKMLKADETNTQIIESLSLIEQRHSQNFLSVDEPLKQRQACVAEGSLDEKAQFFIDILKEKKIL